MSKTHEEILKDIEEHPENHIHDFYGLSNCCLVEGVIDVSLIEAHSKFVNLGTNGSQRCDVTEGPCACNGWHSLDENGVGDFDYRGFPTRREYLESLNKKK
ncbi:MAG: hypothetical protein UT37_C0007G0018 [Parcubacteria group bacterium GW2011_GWA2_39_18]|nr:MAG: hypothetical protein UT37_C0007G0018 [Parcubacteria group bacterium GW2011_GWA2_39_18]